MFWCLIIASVAVLLLAWTRLQVSRTKAVPNVVTREHSGKGSKEDGDVTVSASKIEPLNGFDWKQMKPETLRPFKSIYHITMGLQTSTPSELIVMDQDYADKMEYRRSTIALHPDTVLGAVREGLEPARELYTHLLAEYLPTRYPDMFSLQQGTLRNHVTGDTCPAVPPSSDDARRLLRTLGEHVEDDLFLLVPTPPAGHHRMVAFVCCHPAGFDPSAKLGMVLSDIHGPVPAYDKIGPSMERFFARLEVGRVVKRLNWAISTEPHLFTPGFHHVHEGDKVQEDADVDIEKTRFRVELQSLSRLPKTKAVLFSFKSYLYPLSGIKEESLGPELADAIEGLKKGNAPEMWRYKGAVRWGKSVCEYLRS